MSGPYSPGPWRWEPGEDGNDRLVDADGFVLFEGTCWPRDTGLRHDLLMQAAPQLLEVLEKLLDTMGCDCCSSPGFRDAEGAAIALVRRIREGVAK